MNPPLRNVLPTSLAAVTALLAIGLAQPATAQVVPYVTDSHTLHLYHFDEAAGSGGAADTGNATHINLIDVQQVSISSGVTTGSTAGTGAAAFTGFGNSFKSGPLATDGHMAGAGRLDVGNGHRADAVEHALGDRLGAVEGLAG